MLAGLWAKIINWFENGDLLPAVVLVTVPHYAKVLGEYDTWLAAAALGFLIDLGHYRTIKLYLRSGAGIVWVSLLTVISYVFHLAFYVFGGAGWWSPFFALAVPVVMLALAWISRRENLDKRAAASVVVERTERNLPRPASALQAQAQELRAKGETTAGIIRALISNNPGVPKADIAQAVGVHPSAVSRAVKNAQ